MNKTDKKRFLILKYISIIENTYKKRSDLRIILDDFYEGVKEIESSKPSLNRSSKKNCIEKDCQYYNDNEHKCEAPQDVLKEYKCSPS